jgi:hypothetical protein
LEQDNATNHHISISEAQDQLRTGHRDIRTFFSDTAATARNTNETLANANTTTDNTATGRIGPQRNEVRQRPQQTRTQPAPALTKIRRPGYQDIRNFLPRATAAVKTARDANGHGRNDSAHKQSHLSLSRHSQQITDTTITGDSRHRGRIDQSIRKRHLPNTCPTSSIPNTTNPGDATSNHGRTDHSHIHYLLSLTRTAQPFSNRTNPAKHDFNRHLALLSGTQQFQLRLTALA